MDGYCFASKAEVSVYKQLKLDPRISKVEYQDKVYLTLARILYKPDFKITLKTGEVYWVEVKGRETATWRIKERLWKYYGPGALQVLKVDSKGIHLDRTTISEFGETIKDPSETRRA